jgi:hypothetical protein
VNPSARMTKTSHTKYPFKNCILAPVAKILENKAGAKARIAETTVRAIAFNVPRVACVGAISLSASWIAAKIS